MLISDSLWRKGIVTVVAVGGFLSLYEVTTLDSKYAARQAVLRETTAPPAPGLRLAYTATAYCKGLTTASGVAVRRGVAAADPALLPVGSVVDIDALESRYNGIYTVMDTGPAVQGRIIDLYMWSCNEALSFGRRAIHINILRLGWNPRSAPASLLDMLARPSDAAPLASRPTSTAGRVPVAALPPDSQN
jgi:3D (Asp-Asp-Asp) domain-containing protein